MATQFGTSVFGPQVLTDELERATDRMVFGINENSDAFPRRVGYGYVFARDLTTSARYMFWNGVLYEPGLWLPLPLTSPSSFPSIRVTAFWDISGINWFIDC